jgi:transposase
VKRHKNDAIDAEAICEAATRPNMRFVATKTCEQQSCLTLHRTRHLFIRHQTSVINAIRAHLAEFGIVAPGLDTTRPGKARHAQIELYQKLSGIMAYRLFSASQYGLGPGVQEIK